MTINTRRSDELLKEALEQAAAKGYLHEIPMEHPVLVRGLAYLDELEAENKAAHTEREWPHWANYRLVLGAGEDTQVVFFRRKPTYQEKKAFCAAAGVSPEQVETEERT